MFGDNLIQLAAVDSTNVSAAEILKWEKLAEGSVITAFEQYAGRGQQTSKWESNPGENITMSTVIYPGFLNPSDIFLINEFVSLAIHEFVSEQTDKIVSIKWPNDILVDNKKLCGILIENAWRGNSILHSVIGIGLNLNQTVFNAYKPAAVSIKNITGKSYHVIESIQKLNAKLDKYYQILKSGNKGELHALYQKNLFRINEIHPYQIRGEVVRATLEQVLPDGRLVLKTTHGTQLFFDVKEVKFLY